MFATELNEKFNFNKTCRLCLHENKDLTSIFDISKFKIKYSIMISGCLGVMIAENDELPKSMCLDCKEFLGRFYQFRKLVHDSEHRLQVFLKESRNNLIIDMMNENINKIKGKNVKNNKEPNILQCPTKIKKNQYNLEQDSVNDHTMVEEKLKVDENGIPAFFIKGGKIQNSENVEQLEISENELTVVPTFPIQSEEIQDARLVSKIEINEEELEIDRNDIDIKPISIQSNFEEINENKDFNDEEMNEKSDHTSSNKSGKFFCDQCGRFFTQSSGLMKHKKTHTGEKPYNCDQCGKSFIQSSNLRRHERLHGGEKPFICKQCNKAFKLKHNLKKHERTHSGVKPYACKECNKRFSSTSSLREHEFIHSDEKPYDCKDCGKSFASLSKLSAHEKWHRCNQCTSKRSSDGIVSCDSTCSSNSTTTFPIK